MGVGRFSVMRGVGGGRGGNETRRRELRSCCELNDGPAVESEDFTSTPSSAAYWPYDLGQSLLSVPLLLHLVENKLQSVKPFRRSALWVEMGLVVRAWLPPGGLHTPKGPHGAS